eukprot:scpid4648/ scgid21691/ Uncharacterized protein MJ1187
MGSSFSLEEAAVSKIRSFDRSRNVSFEEYLKHISGTDSLDAQTVFPKEVFSAKFLMLRSMSLAFHALRSIPGEAPYYSPHLQHFDCSHNRLRALPGNFGHFLHLRVLLLSYNSLSSLPASMAEMSELQRVDISHNAFTDFPPVLLQISSLEQLNLSFNMLSALPADLAKLERLTTVLCHMNRCAVPPQEVCNKGSSAILSFFASQLDQTTAASSEGTTPNSTSEQQTPTEGAAGAGVVGPVFKRESCPEAPSLLNKLVRSSRTPTLGERQKTPLRVPSGATTLSNEQLTDRIAGLVYGAALGDAVGLATEFMMREECRFHYGVDGERLCFKNIVHDRHRCKWQKGDWTDDTDQMILILQSLVQWAGVVDEVDFAKRLKHWCDKGFPELGDAMGQGIGATVGRVTMKPEFLVNPHEAAHQQWEGTDNAANGAIMRTSILGVPHFHDLDTVRDNVLRICKTTHYDPRCQASCVSLCSALALLLQGKHDCSDASQVELLLTEATQRGRDLLSDEKHLVDFARYTSVHSFEEVHCDKPGEIGYTLKPLAAAWVTMRQDGDFKSQMTSLAMEGGDADSNATVAGALLGCRLGYSGLPADWLNGLLPKNVDWLNLKLNALLDLMAVT